MRHVAFGIALLVTGCFRWAPASSLGSIQNDRVQIREGGDAAIINHATARGQIIEGQADEGGAHVEVDAVRTHVFVRRLDVPVTVALVSGSVVLAAGTAFGLLVLAILASSQPVADARPP